METDLILIATCACPCCGQAYDRLELDAMPVPGRCTSCNTELPSWQNAELDAIPEADFVRLFPDSDRPKRRRLRVSPTANERRRAFVVAFLVLQTVPLALWNAATTHQLGLLTLLNLGVALVVQAAWASTYEPRIVP